ncbi:hypothetical protein QE372_005233 [Agrobacterium pusense]|nr:hypothetical protein [Agrobacterium pusense]
MAMPLNKKPVARSGEDRLPMAALLALAMAGFITHVAFVN